MQLAVTLLLVLRGVLSLAAEVERAWLFCYIDHLQRLQLWSAASHVIALSGHGDIVQLTQQSTTVHTSCSHCGKPMTTQSGGFHHCGSCSRATSACAVCRLNVKGVLAWCMGCGHGGHVTHMTSWFRRYTACPAGCGHQCVIASAAPPPSPLALNAPPTPGLQGSASTTALLGTPTSVQTPVLAVPGGAAPSALLATPIAESPDKAASARAAAAAALHASLAYGDG